MSESAPDAAALLAKSRTVYTRYLNDLEKISENRNQGYGRLKSYLSKEAYDSEVESFKALSEKGLHTEGATKLVKFLGQRVDGRSGSVTAYACLDLAAVRVIDTAGNDVTPASRPDRQTFLPSFKSVEGQVMLRENGTWSGESVC